MKYAINKIDKSGKRIIDFIESFERLVEHLKMLYPTNATFLSNVDVNSLKSDPKYRSGDRVMILNRPKATLYRKEEKDNSGFFMSGKVNKMIPICTWELIRLDIMPTRQENTKSTIELGNFKLKNYMYGSVSLVHGENTTDVDSILTTALSRLDTTSKRDSIIISNHLQSTTGSSITFLNGYDIPTIDKAVSRNHKKIIFIDNDVEMSAEDTVHMYDLMRTAKDKKLLIITVKDCSDVTKTLIDSSDKLLLLSSVDIDCLGTMYGNLNIKHLFSTPKTFISMFKQLTTKFGVMVISPGSKSEEMVSWYRL